MGPKQLVENYTFVTFDKGNKNTKNGIYLFIFLVLISYSATYLPITAYNLHTYFIFPTSYLSKFNIVLNKI
jgi:hypothetical protein